MNANNNFVLSKMSIVDRLILSMLRIVPKRLGAHTMWLLRQHNDVVDRWGYHVRQNHYYEPLPDFRAITSQRIRRRSEMRSVDLRVDAQLRLLGELTTYREELSKLQQDEGASAFNFANDYFSHHDAAVYYALIRHLRPKRVLEIGAGFSTRIAAKALARNAESGDNAALVVVEPYPQPRLLEAKLDMRLIEQPVQSVNESEFELLSAGDILFIDSSHTVKFDSDVCHLFLSILPLLAKGVWVHVHDIFLPFEYPEDWLLTRRLAFNEQYLLQTFLSGNPSWRVEMCGHMLAVDHSEPLDRLWDSGSIKASTPSSFWMQKV